MNQQKELFILFAAENVKNEKNQENKKKEIIHWRGDAL